MSTNLISKIFVAVLVLGVAMVTLSFVNRSAASVVADRSYDTIEQIRINAASVAADHSYDAIEQLRLKAFTASHVTTSGYDQIEALRLHRTFIASGYDQVEALRARRSQAAQEEQAYLDQRHGEQMTGVNAAKAYLDYRRGEWSGK